MAPSAYMIAAHPGNLAIRDWGATSRQIVWPRGCRVRYVFIGMYQKPQSSGLRMGLTRTVTVIGVPGDDRPRLVAFWDALLQTGLEAFVLSSIYYQVGFYPSIHFMMLNSTLR